MKLLYIVSLVYATVSVLAIPTATTTTSATATDNQPTIRQSKKLFKRDKGPGGGSAKKSNPGLDKKVLHALSKLDSLVDPLQNGNTLAQPAANVDVAIPPAPGLLPLPFPAPSTPAPVKAPAPPTPPVTLTLPSSQHPPAGQLIPSSTSSNQQSSTIAKKPTSSAGSDLRPMNLGVGLSDLSESISVPISTTSSAIDTTSTTTSEPASESASTASETTSTILEPQQQQSSLESTFIPNQPMDPTNNSTSTFASSKSISQTGLVAGLTVGIICLVLLVYLFYSKKRSRIQKESAISLQGSNNQDFFKNVPSYLAKASASTSYRQDSFASTININDLSQNYQVPSIHFETLSTSFPVQADEEDGDTILSKRDTITFSSFPIECPPVQFNTLLPPPPQLKSTSSPSTNPSPLQARHKQQHLSPLQPIITQNPQEQHDTSLAKPVVGTLAERMAVYDRIRLSNMPTPSD